MKAEIIDWRITSKCSDKCGFCYASKTIAEMSDDQTENIINAIISTDCQAVCVTGGEPLIDKKAIHIIKKLYDCGIAVYLSTNGINYLDNISEIEPYISKLSLPLDGFDNDSNTINGRELKSFSRVKSILDVYNKKNHTFPIKVGTVLTRKNMDIAHFLKMYELLKMYSIDMWKIYQFIPEARGEQNKEEYGYTDNEYQNFIEEFNKVLLDDVDNRQFDITFSSRKGRNSAYFIIQPDGTVIIPIDKGEICEEHLIGDLKTESINSLFDKWQKRIIDMNCIENSETRNIVRPIHKIHIDNIDRELLYYLDRSPLQKVEDLALSIGQTTDATTQRIDKLYQIRAIKQIIPIINVASFGFDVYLVSLFFTVNSNASNISDILCHHSNIAWVAECYDWNEENKNAIFRIAIFAEDNFKVSSVINEISEIFGRSMYRYEIDIVPDKYVCDQRYLLENSVQKGIDTSHITLNHNRKIRISSGEYKLLCSLKYIERMNVQKIATYLNISEKRTQDYIDELQRQLIINKFQAVFDSNILGYNCYLLFIKFSSLLSKKEFEDYAKRHISVSHINTLNAGKWDIDVEIRVEKAEQCFALWKEIESLFGKKIISSKLIRIQKEHKFDFLIPAITEAIERDKRSFVRRGFN